MYIIYKIYYGNILVYLGRTSLKLQTRLYNHFHKSPNIRTLDINQVTKIEYAEFETEADMFLYEIYYINLYKPCFNKDDKSKGELTIDLPEVEWKEFTSYLIDKWKKNIYFKDKEKKEIDEQKRILAENYKKEKILRRETMSREEYWKWLDE